MIFVQRLLWFDNDPGGGHRAAVPRLRGATTPQKARKAALLVARGLTNRRIAEELSISERTVENHIGKIFKKLGFSSRSQIAAWVAQR